jgi:ParB family transcriptional regulator, chromosome partitioning protein
LSTNSGPTERPKPRLGNIKLDELEVGPTNVRRREIAADIDELARSLDEIGLQQPIVVHASNGRYEVLVGQRRFYAAKKLGWDEIPALVYDESFDEVRAVEISLSENIQRRELDPRDRSEAVEYLLGKRGGNVSEVARALGVSEQTIRNWRLFNAIVPASIKQLVFDKKVTRPVALRLSQAIPDEDRALKVAEYIARTQPAKEVRTRIVEAAEELGDRPPEVILARAEEKGNELTITFALGARHARRIQSAADELEKVPDDVAYDATVEWLDKNRY